MTHYAILNIILYAFYEWSGDKLTFSRFNPKKRIQSGVRDNVMRDAKARVSVNV